jgi:hypothetical protein
VVHGPNDIDALGPGQGYPDAFLTKHGLGDMNDGAPTTKLDFGHLISECSGSVNHWRGLAPIGFAPMPKKTLRGSILTFSFVRNWLTPNGPIAKWAHFH